MTAQSYVRWFKDLRVGDVALVGGKNSSLGELYAAFPRGAVRVPNGFAVTASTLTKSCTLSSQAKSWSPMPPRRTGSR